MMIKKIIHSLNWRLQKKLEKPLERRLEKKIQAGIIENVKKKKLGYEGKIIVSLTSFPDRFRNISLCIKSLLMQTVAVDKVIVWLGSDSKQTDLTDEMVELKKYGVEFRFDDEKNLKPHKKYYYAMNEFKNAIVITVDDDVIYPVHMIERLFKCHMKYPDAVCAGRVHRMTFDGEGKIKPYDLWMHEDDIIKIPSYELVPIGIGGVLYPPGCLDEAVLNLDGINRCINADDLWLKCAAVSKGTKTVRAQFASRFLKEIEDSQIKSLKSENVDLKRNDTYLQTAMNYFGLTSESFIE